jgi:ribosomal protein S18 acetylase RimI-like enzyme
MIELVPFTETDIDRLLGWFPTLESLLLWTASSFGYPLTRELTRAFEEHQAHRVELGVFDINPRAIRCYERVGFRREGVRRDSFKAPEGYWSEITMSILDSEWAARRVEKPY